MKKILKITGIIFFVIITVIVILIVIFSKAQSVPENYWEKIDSSSDIENRYNKLGKYEVEKKNMTLRKMTGIKMIIILLSGIRKKKVLIRLL